MKDYVITGKTKCFAIIGDPVEQALSPIINNGGFNGKGDDALMVGLNVKQENVKQALDGVRALNIGGLSVTMPLKSAVIPYLDECEEKIKYLGAVNVITNHNGWLKGYNTDGDGFVMNMKAHGADPKGKIVLLFGAGGAAKGVCYALLDAKIAKLIICNRSEQTARELIDLLKGKFSTEIDYISTADPSLSKICQEADLLVNSTSMGMKGNPSPHIDWVPWSSLKPGTWIGDVVNKPIETDFIKKARECGLQVFTGDGMTLYQATIVYRLLMETEDVPFESMRAALEKQMGVKV